MKKLSIIVLSAISLLASQTTFAKSKTYTLDSEHSSVGFKIAHLVSKVSGTFNIVEGKIEFDAEKNKLKTSGKIDAASIDTNVQKRDDHLRSADFFDVNNEKNPQFKWITFESYKFSDITTDANATKGKLHGKITIHGVTRPIVLDVTIHGKPILDPWGFERLSMNAVGTLNRKDFGLTWNKAVETGGFVVGDQVELSMDIEAIVKADAPKTEAAGKPATSAKDDKSVIIKSDKKEDKPTK